MGVFLLRGCMEPNVRQIVFRIFRFLSAISAKAVEERRLAELQREIDEVLWLIETNLPLFMLTLFHCTCYDIFLHPYVGSAPCTAGGYSRWSAGTLR